MIVDVVWLKYHEGFQNHGAWGMHLLEDLFSGGVSPLQNLSFVHRESFEEVPRESRGVVVAVAGRTHQYMIDIMKLNSSLRRFDWSHIMVVSDEENLFKHEELQGRNIRTWVAECSPSRKVHHRLPTGPGPNRHLLKSVSHNKTLDWMFAGQVTHERRRDCVKAFRGLPNGVLVETNSFFEQKMSQEDYYKTLASAKIIPCPSGASNPDSWRVWEGLESGGIPIVDNKTPWERYPGGYWEKLFGEKPPFPIVDDWSQAPGLVEDLLVGWDAKAKIVGDWWMTYKTNLVATLENEITELSKT